MILLLLALGALGYLLIGYGVIVWAVSVQPISHAHADRIAHWGGVLVILLLAWPLMLVFAICWTVKLLVKPSGAVGHIARSPSRHLKRIDAKRDAKHRIE